MFQAETQKQCLISKKVSECLMKQCKIEVMMLGNDRERSMSLYRVTNKMSSTFFADLWLNSAQIAEKYGLYYKKKKEEEKEENKTQKIRDTAKSNEDSYKEFASFSKFLEDVRDIMVSCTTKNSINLCLKYHIHHLYLSLAREGSKCHQLQESGVLRLLAFTNLELIPLNAISDHVQIFEMVINQLVLGFDELSEEENDTEKTRNLEEITKYINVFLIRCLNCNQLPKDFIDQIAQFTHHCAQCFLTRTEMVDIWFEQVQSDPDVRYIILVSRLPVYCFPLFELSKELLFLDDKSFDIARESLLHIILITEFSEPLRNWILGSEFPSLIITGLLSNFNQLCYSEILDHNHDIEYEDILVENPTLLQYNFYLQFIIEILSYSSHEEIRTVFMNCLENRFMAPVIEYYPLNEAYHTKIVVLLAHTIEKLITNRDLSISDTTIFIAEELINNYSKHNEQEESSSSIISVFAKSMFSSFRDDNSIDLIASLKLFAAFAHTKSMMVLIKMFCSSVSVVPSQTNEIPIYKTTKTFSLISNIMFILEQEPLYKELLFVELDKSLKKLRRTIILDHNGQPCSDRWLKLDSSKPVTTLLLFSFLKFFTNEPQINSQLVTTLKSILFAHGGKILNFMLDSSMDGRSETAFFMVFRYLWKSFKMYLKCGCLKSTDRYVTLPSDEILKLFRNSESFMIEEYVHAWVKELPNTEIRWTYMATNLEIFLKLVISLYAAEKAKNIIYHIELK